MTGFEAIGLPGADCAHCPVASPNFYRLGAEGANRFPPGVVRRVDAIPPPSPDEVDEAKRSTLKLALIAGALALSGAGAASFLRFAVPPPSGAASYPRVQLLYSDGSPILGSSYRYPSTSTALIVFDYPLDNEPNMLLNLPTAAPGGVGPQSTLVAYSAICQHLGCTPPFISYYPPGTCGSFNNGAAFIHCVCHGSTYNPYALASGGGASIITGPAMSALPQVTLFWDESTDEVFATGVVGPPVKGHTNTLVGGNVVTYPLETQSPQTPTQQCPV